jgi:LPS sulfotransferase NodH
MKLRVRFLQLPILFDADRLAEEVAAIPESAWRGHPKGFPGNDALTLITNDGDPNSDARGGPMAPTPHLLALPCLMQVLETLGGTWGRSRLMRLSGDSEVTPHIDTDYYWRDHMRVHVPIVTQPTVRFICGDEQVNMAAGECWIFDTWSLHSVRNDATRARIHLVADTVGGGNLVTLMEQGKSPTETKPGWTPKLSPPRAGPAPTLAYEARNLPQVMTPWEMRDHLGFLLSEVPPGIPKVVPIAQALNRLRANWHALWARSGDDPAARPEYAALLEQAREAVTALGAHDIAMRNNMRLGASLNALIFASALGGGPGGMDADDRISPTGQTPAVSAPAILKSRDPVFDRPIFIVSSPRSGSTLLFETLARAPGLATTGKESHALMESVPGMSPAARDWDSNRMTAADVVPAIVAPLRDRFRAALLDRAGAPVAASPVRMLEKTPKNALRIPFLAGAFPEARFIYLHREPQPTLASMMEAWSSGGFRTYPQLPGWTGLDWSLLLVPGWREMIGAPLNRIVATQWATTMRLLSDDLAALPPDRWRSIRYEAFIASPQAEIARLCRELEIDWDVALQSELPLARFTVSAPNAEKWRASEAAIEEVRAIWSAEHQRALALVD